MARVKEDHNAPLLNEMHREEAELHPSFYEDTPAYRALKDANVLETKYRRKSVDDIFTGVDIVATANKGSNLRSRCLHGYYCLPGVGCCLYHSTHLELFVPAGHVGLLMDEQNRYLFAQPGMHNIQSIYVRSVGTQALRGLIQHGNRTIVIVEQGFLGYARDNGQPVLLPPGIHVWTSESLEFVESKPLDDHLCHFGPYTLVTVDEGYAAVTQNNGKQHILEGGFTHFLSHKNWRFEKFITLKIQTDELERIEATSADNINMTVTSTVNWRIRDVKVAATMAAETMNSSGTGNVSADISKLRRDVLKQAIASLAGFIGSVNYSNSFHLAAAAQASRESSPQIAEAVPVPDATDDDAGAPTFNENPLYDEEKMSSSVDHANKVTQTYGVEIMSINIISATPCDQALTRALASGAVASAEALQAETAARGKARAVAIEAEAEAARCKIASEGEASAKLVHAQADAEAERVRAEGARDAAEKLATSQVAVDLAKMDRSAKMLNPGDKYFFGETPAMLSNVILKGANVA